MKRFKILLIFLTAAIGASGSYHTNQHYKNNYFMPRCKYDDQLLKNDDQVEKELAKSDFVFTGKVSNADIVYRDNQIIFGVTVRRYFKNVFHYSKNQEVRVAKRLNDGEGVKCRLAIRPKFTAIFIGRKIRGPLDVDISLIVGPVPVTLYNLDRISSATKDELPYDISSYDANYDRIQNLEVKTFANANFGGKFNITCLLFSHLFVNSKKFDFSYAES
ncbi:hypothetical protein GWI33_019717 [Rhynchophorus ferrugineus]|uniref:Uncharacterized protein n=1 Tax=Rhynchophorus ferrugineus TaxID=354439 RepID=A0A834M081_RHYFE|nr:hypothetical protein GWI33_019717 [Rhynchophorus ferrugineus]